MDDTVKLTQVLPGLDQDFDELKDELARTLIEQYTSPLQDLEDQLDLLHAQQVEVRREINSRHIDPPRSSALFVTTDAHQPISSTVSSVAAIASNAWTGACSQLKEENQARMQRLSEMFQQFEAIKQALSRGTLPSRAS